MVKGIVIGVIAVIVLGAGGYFALHKPKNSSTYSYSSAQSSNAPSTTSTEPSASTSTATSTSTAKNESFTINANDDSADKESVTVAKGSNVSITFNVSEQGTYHGGLDFKSDDPAIDSGSIKQGSSKTVTFVANKTFSFTPYWYQSGIKKSYLITVNVN